MHSFETSDMHELTIARSLIEIIEQECLTYAWGRVIKIELRLGKLSGIMPDPLRFAFEVMSIGGITEGASLLIEEVPLRIKCNQCRKVSIVDDPFLICPYCKGTDVEMIGGCELEIRGIEIEDGNQDNQEDS
jgi:hydrogenase nickel incorporation protein HypA/HybF